LNTNKRPLAIGFLALLYLAVGLIGLVNHFPELRETLGPHWENIWIEATELLAILCGIFLFRGANWARWLAVAWIALHVVLSVFDNSRGLLVHSVLAAATTWLLFRPESNQYFLGSQTKPG
jgi:hypothetical protein